MLKKKNLSSRNIFQLKQTCLQRIANGQSSDTTVTGCIQPHAAETRCTSMVPGKKIFKTSSIQSMWNGHEFVWKIARQMISMGTNTHAPWLYRMNNSSSTLFRRLLKVKDEPEQEKQRNRRKEQSKGSKSNQTDTVEKVSSDTQTRQVSECKHTQTVLWYLWERIQTGSMLLSSERRPPAGRLVCLWALFQLFL